MNDFKLLSMKYKFIYLFAVSILFSATTFAQPANGNTKDALLKSGDEQVEKGQYYSCLLYTSPSPRDRTRYRMPSSA